MSERDETVIWVTQPQRRPARSWLAGGLLVVALVAGLALGLWVLP